MPDTQKNTALIRFLLTSLGILFIFILSLVIILAAYPALLAPPPTATPTPTRVFPSTATSTLSPTITPSPTVTNTRRPTFTPTITLTATRTPTPTLTPSPTGLPTLTPARPALGTGIYKLSQWEADDAAYMVDLIENYPNTLLRQQRGDNDESYYAAYSYTTTALSEALLRFPEAPQATHWRWELAYNLARTSDPNAGAHYADLIAQALNQEQVMPTDLDRWFHEQEPRLELDVTLLKQPPGYLSGYLLQIKGGGSAFILLLETSSAFQTQILTSNFDFIRSPEYNAIAADLTGDGIQEIVLYLASPVETRELALPHVYTLASIPAQEVAFNLAESAFNVGMDYSAEWLPVPDGTGGFDLQVSDTLFPACPLALRRTYHWNEGLFQPKSTVYEVNPGPSTLSFCRLLVDHAASVWGPGAAIQIMQTILPNWPPVANENGKPFPPDARDEWRYRLGVYQALLGEHDAAVHTFQEIINSPAIINSSWIAPAQDFLITYPSPSDIYRSCVRSELCDPDRALAYLVENLQGNDFPRAQTVLGEAGVELRASGYFDFDGDNTSEVWFTLRHRPGEKLKFWVLAAYPKGIEAIQLGEIETNVPGLAYYDEDLLPPVVLINNSRAIRMERVPGTLEPYLTYPELPKFYPDRFKDGLKIAIRDLFAGVEPAQVKKALLGLQKAPGLLCRGTWTCDEYYYMLGLSSELAGDRTGAIDAYVRVWTDYSKSPFTTMARLKLIGVVHAASPTPTITSTQAASVTPSGTTLTPTETTPVSGTPPAITLTPTITPSPLEETPYPGPTEFFEETPTVPNPYPTP